jgi:exodeoxyribonuclease-3
LLPQKILLIKGVCLKIISWNVNGIRAVYKKNLADFLIQYKPDIFCVQETKAHIDQVEDAARKLGFQQSFWSSAKRKGYSGVATFLNAELKSVKLGLGIDIYDDEGRVVVTEHKKFILFNIYFPNGGSGEIRHQFKQKFLSDLNEHLIRLIKTGKSIIVVGDYNIAPTAIDLYDPIKLAKESGFLPEEREWFGKFLDLGFVDTFRYIHPNEDKKYSWWSYRELARISNRGWRIDHIAITKDLLPFLKSAEILDQVEGSDHCPVMIELED